MAQKITPGLALRQLQQAQQAMKKVRKGLVQVREADPARRAELAQPVLQAGWEALTRTHRDLAEIPLASATEEVMLRQIAVQRYATALLVRLRRLVRNDPDALEGLDDDED
ncbi:hypothetical protein [Tautonia plasticadhaerens]|uniref:Uncharacterized protein n=1 Tax=Tautonia plasticadhaerens TaxID=2527974 RepID=A0A518HAP6_9BACT|nr:hypothetical protein [Tautonia plasticadhaerens]QDV37918.1 hypothetical protein ElP_58650 [Tautonia plasticadhaerens]